MEISLERIHDWIDDVYDLYQREEEQAIMQRNMEKAVHALAGKEACERLRNSIGLRAEMAENAARVLAGKRRA
jgi:predicted secreted Zn-dependent protease